MRIGLNTQGVFSDVLGRKLPNGWSFGLPNEVYPTKDGKAFDGAGIPPDLAGAVLLARRSGDRPGRGTRQGHGDTGGQS
jgi:C-terminal processing protease CtpA/Prc